MKATSMNGASGALGRQLVQKFAQLGRGLELRDRIQLLEGAGECVGQTPHRASREFLVLWIKIQPVDLGQQTPRRVQLAINECSIVDQLRPFVSDLRLPPVFDLTQHWVEVPLKPFPT